MAVRGGGYGPVDHVDFDAVPASNQKRLMDDVTLYENSQALGVNGRQQLLYQYANLSKPRGRNALTKMQSPAQGAAPLPRVNGAADPTPPPPAGAAPQPRPNPLSSKLEQRWGKGEVEELVGGEEDFAEPSPYNNYDRQNASQHLSPRMLRQRHLPDPNFGGPRRSHDREYHLQQQQQQQYARQPQRQQPPMDPFQQQYRQQQQYMQQQRQAQQQQMLQQRPPRGGRAQMRSTQVRREDFVEGRRGGGGGGGGRLYGGAAPLMSSAPVTHLQSPRRGRGSPGFDSDEEAPVMTRTLRRVGNSPGRPDRDPGGTTDMYKNFEQTMEERYSRLRKEFDENLTHATIDVSRRKTPGPIMPEEAATEPAPVLDIEGKSVLKYSSGYNYKTRKAPSHIYPLEHNGSESAETSTPPSERKAASFGKKKSRFLRRSAPRSASESADDEDSDVFGRTLLKRADPDGGEEEFHADSSIAANCTKIDDMLKRHRREEAARDIGKRVPRVAVEAEKDLMLMYAEQEAGVENVESIKQKAEMEGRDMEVRIVAGEVVVMTIEEAAAFDEKNEMEKRLSRKLMLLADDDDSDDDAAAKKVRAAELEVRKKMREELAKKKEEVEPEDDEELMSEEERVLEAKAKMKETQKILHALERATAEDQSSSESEDERRKRIEKKANESLLKKKTENMKLLDFLKAGESNNIASEMITEKEEMRRKKAVKKAEREKAMKEEEERKKREEEERVRAEEERVRREEEERIRKEEEEKKRKEEEERKKREEEERIKREEEERKRRAEEEKRRKEEEERKRKEEEERKKREEEERRRREEEERKRREEEEKRRREEEARREAERIAAEKLRLKKEMDALQEKMRAVEEEEKDKKKMKEMLELGQLDEASFFEERLKSIAEEKRKKKEEEDRQARLSDEERFRAKRLAEEAQFIKEKQDSSAIKAQKRAHLRDMLEEEKKRNMEREEQHMEEMRLLQLEAQENQRRSSKSPQTSSVGFDVCAMKPSTPTTPPTPTTPSSKPPPPKAAFDAEEERAKAKRAQEERLMFEQECFQMTDSFTEQLFASEANKKATSSTTTTTTATSAATMTETTSPKRSPSPDYLDSDDEELRRMEAEHERKMAEMDERRKTQDAEFFSQMLEEEQKWLEDNDDEPKKAEAERRRKALAESERLIREAEELAKELEDVDIEESIERKIEKRAQQAKIPDDDEDRKLRGKSPKRGVPGMPKFASLPKIKEVKEKLADLSSGSEDEAEDVRKKPLAALITETTTTTNGDKKKEPSSPTMTIKGDVSVKDEKGKEISRLLDGKEMQVENERTILIKNVKGVNIVKISKGDTWIKNHGIDEKVAVGNNRVTICNADGVQMVEVRDGEISVQDFDGEVIVKNMDMERLSKS